MWSLETGDPEGDWGRVKTVQMVLSFIISSTNVSEVVVFQNKTKGVTPSEWNMVAFKYL